MLCREQFLKHPPEKLNQHILSPTRNDFDKNKLQKLNKNKPIVSDDVKNWTTDDEGDGEKPVRRSPRRRNKGLLSVQEQIELGVMKTIYEAQTEEVKQVIMSLHQMHLEHRKAIAERRKMRATAPRPFCTKKRNKAKQLMPKKRINFPINSCISGGTLQNNRKILARIQRRRHSRRKPKKQKGRKRFPRRKRRCNAKTGNRQYRKRISRAQKFFNKGIFITGRKLMDQIWKSLKDSNGNLPDFLSKYDFQGLSKLHLQQIAAYERIEEDLQRLNITRQERAKAAEERKAKELEKEEVRKDFKNKIVARAAAHAENDALRKERRAVRKKRALDKKLRQQTAKAEIRLYCKSTV